MKSRQKVNGSINDLESKLQMMRNKEAQLRNYLRHSSISLYPPISNQPIVNHYNLDNCVQIPESSVPVHITLNPSCDGSVSSVTTASEYAISDDNIFYADNTKDGNCFDSLQFEYTGNFYE